MPADAQLPLTLTVAEAAVLLRVSRQTMYRSIERGEWPTLKVNGRIVIPTHGLLARLGLGAHATEGDVRCTVGDACADAPSEVGDRPASGPTPLTPVPRTTGEGPAMAANTLTDNAPHVGTVVVVRLSWWPSRVPALVTELEAEDGVFTATVFLPDGSTQAEQYGVNSFGELWWHRGNP